MIQINIMKPELVIIITDSGIDENQSKNWIEFVDDRWNHLPLNIKEIDDKPIIWKPSSMVIESDIIVQDATSPNILAEHYRRRFLWKQEE